MIDEAFDTVVGALNKISIQPIIYGSYGLKKLGLEVLPNDLDFLIDDKVMFDLWSAIQQIMNNLGYPTDPDHNQEFGSDELYISFLSTTEIEHLIGHRLDVEAVEEDGKSYGQLSLAEQRKIYIAGLKNKWRRQKKETADRKIIDLIDQTIQ